jgi:hypothetical protein
MGQSLSTPHTTHLPDEHTDPVVLIAQSELVLQGPGFMSGAGTAGVSELQPAPSANAPHSRQLPKLSLIGSS